MSADYVAFSVTAVVRFTADEEPNADLWSDLMRRVEAIVEEPKYKPIMAALAP